MKIRIPSTSSDTSSDSSDRMERFVQPLGQSVVSPHKVFFERTDAGAAEMQQVLDDFGYSLEVGEGTMLLQKEGETVGEIDERDSGTFFVMYGDD
jgi:hypothetical protein